MKTNTLKLSVFAVAIAMFHGLNGYKYKIANNTRPSWGYEIEVKVSDILGNQVSKNILRGKEEALTLPLANCL